MADDESTSLQEGSVADDTQDATAPPEGKNPYDITDPEVLEKINSRIEKKLRADRFTRSQFEWEWFRNIVIAAGQHDIVRFRGVVRLRKAPDWYPRTYTNKFAEKYRDLLSALLTGRVPIRYLPATDNPEDQGTADVGERVRDVIYSEAKVDGKENEIGTWFVLTGNVFLVPYYDYDDKYGSEEVPKLECQTCGNTYGAEDVADDENGIDDQNPMCPYCQNAGLPNQPLTPSETETDTLPIGSLCVDVVSPFEIRGDTRKRDYHEWTWFCRLRRYDSSYAKEKWGWKTAESDTDGSETTIHYLDVLSQISDSFNPQMGITSSNAGGERIPKVTAYEYYELPSDDFPEGLRVVRLGKDCEGIKEAGPLTTEYGAGVRKGKKFLPLSFIGAECVPGRFWRKSPLTDAVPLQTFRNLVERAIKLEFQRMANSVWLNPKGSGVNLFNGEAGWICNYNPLTLGGTTIAKPERVPPQLQHLQMMIELLKFIDDAIEKVTGTYFLQGGECASEDVECLTKEGWKHHSQLNVGDEIYGFDVNEQKGVWTPVVRVYRNEHFDGELHALRGQTVRGLFTPNHDWVVGNLDEPKRINSGKGRPRIREKGLFKVPTIDLKTHHFIPSSYPHLDKEDAPYSDEFIQLVGWVVTDGHYGHHIYINQSARANGHKCRRIEKMLNDLNVEWTKRIRNGEQYRNMSEFAVKGEFAQKFKNQFPDKRPGLAFIASLSVRQLKLLIGAMMDGDGHRREYDGKRKHYTARFSSADKKLAEQFQFAATLAGYSTTIAFRNRGEDKRKRKLERYENGEYRVTLKANRKINVMRMLQKSVVEHYKGTIWCPTTGTGNWIARSQGGVFLTGNSPPGVTAASALALLDERAKKAMSPLVREWAKGFLDFDEKALEIARQHWTSDRLRVVMGRNKKYQVDAFTAADLQGAVNMDIDYEAMFPKSNATERAEIAQLIQMMILNPGDPQQKLQILKKYGATELLGSIDIDIEEAQKEQADFLVHGKPPQLVPLVQNSFVHFSEHCDFAKTDEFKELPPEQQEVWLAHIQATCVDMGARRALFAEMGLNPDAPEAAEMGSGAAQSALQGGQSVLGPNFDQGQGAIAPPPQPGQTLPGTQPGSQVGAGGPSKPSPRKGTTGNGPNQAKAQEARNPVARPIPDIGMIHPPQ